MEEVSSLPAAFSDDATVKQNLQSVSYWSALGSVMRSESLRSIDRPIQQPSRRWRLADLRPAV